MLGELVLHNRRKGFENNIEERAEESDKAALQKERFVSSTFCTFSNVNF